MKRTPFGTFSPMFKATAGYLELLNLATPGKRRAVSLAVKCCRASENPHQEIAEMLKEMDWRPHIVAAVAIAVLDFDQRSIHQLWAAIDGGSWVTPQLAAIAYLKDPQFAACARTRIEARCPVYERFADSTTESDGDCATGTKGTTIQVAKMAAALVRLVSLLPGPPEWIETERSSPEILDLLSCDVDVSGNIAERWSVRLTTILRSLDIGLV